MSLTSADSFRSRLTLVLSILLLPLVAYMVLVGWYETEEQTAHARETVRYLAEIASKYERNLFSGTEMLFKGLAEQPEIRIGGAICDEDLQRVARAMPDYRSIAVVDGSGAITCGALPAKGMSLADRDYFADIQHGASFAIGASKVGTESGQSSVSVGLPWRNPDGTLAGAIVADIDLKRLESMSAALDLPPDSRFYLFDRHGVELVGDRDLPNLPDESAYLSAALSGHEDHFIASGKDGVQRIFSVTPIEGGAITAILGIPARSGTAVGDVDRAIAVLGPIALWLIAIAIVWFVTDLQIGRPLRALAQAAGPIGAADPSVPRSLRGPAELRELAANFGETALRIAARDRELRDAIATREAMLREIHHRVKNNLQIVTSLLNLQAKAVQGEDAKRAFGEIQTRVRALALVHRYLYESDDLKSVNLGAFLKELAASLQLSYGVSEEQVAIEVEAEAVWDISDRAVPLALFMTEAMTNALKHAFPQGRRGRIRIILKSLPDGIVRFSVEDNGVGLTEAQIAAGGRHASLGMSLIKAFARQVEGKLTISGPPGTVVAIEFVNKFRFLAIDEA